MKKQHLIAVTASLFASCLPFSYAHANDMSVSGFMEFEGNFISDDTAGSLDAADNGNTDLDFGVDGRLNFDFARDTKAGLNYGGHFELDLYQSDDNDTFPNEGVSFNDGHVFIKSALGNLYFGDSSAIQDEDYAYNQAENETIKFEYSLVGFDLSAATDDDENWTIGGSYALPTPVGQFDLDATYGKDESFSFIASTTFGGFTFKPYFSGTTNADGGVNASSALNGICSDGTNACNAEGANGDEAFRSGLEIGYNLDAVELKFTVDEEFNETKVDTHDTDYIFATKYNMADGLQVGAEFSIDEDDDFAGQLTVKVTF